MSTSRRVSADSPTLGVTQQTPRQPERRVDSVVSLDWKQRDTTERVKDMVIATAVVNAMTTYLTGMASAEKVAEMIGKGVQHAVPDVTEKEAHHAAIIVKEIQDTETTGETIVEMTAVTVIATREEVVVGITTTATEDRDIECLI